jgi:collagen type VI alpha
VGNVPVLVLLTDGRANPEPAEVAVERAAAAKADGITVFTIGLGNELDFDALARIASRPEFFYHAPDAADLAAIYAAIAVTVPCPRAAFWGGR